MPENATSGREDETVQHRFPGRFRLRLPRGNGPWKDVAGAGILSLFITEHRFLLNCHYLYSTMAVLFCPQYLNRVSLLYKFAIIAAPYLSEHPLVLRHICHQLRK